MAMTALVIGLGGSGVWTLLHVKKMLMDTYDNTVPASVSLAAFDTEKKALDYRLGNSDDAVREKGMGTGAVKLDPAEFSFIGGDAFDWAREMERGDANASHPYWHVRRWFLTERFLKDLPRSTWQLDQGAGQFRQFGRLAMFRDVQAPGSSALAAVIDVRLRSLLQSAAGSTIPVVITGSIVGGTGSGFFIDLAHLVRRVAAITGVKVNVRGFFYTPEAFQRTLNGQEMVPAKPRAFAALRELRRFILNEDYKYGYPMHYHSPNAGVNNDLWRATSTEKLYDFVYLLDGTNPGNPGAQLNNYLLKDGTASVAADAIVSFIDDGYGPKQEAYEVNTKGKIQDRQGQVGKLAFISTLGSYSIILPMQQIIEGWSYRLAGEVLNDLLPASANTQYGYIQQLSSQQNQEITGRPEGEVTRLLTSVTEVMDTRHTDRRAVRPLPLWRHVYEMHQNVRKSNRDNVLRILATLDLRQWLDMLVPPQTDQDAEIRNLMQQTGAVLGARFPDMVLPSDERRPKGDAGNDWREIETRGINYIDQQLGMPAAGGGRQGGTYRNALKQFTELQIRRFRDYMTVYLTETLNGSDLRDPQKARRGKLGWTLAVMNEMADLFSEVSELVRSLQTGVGAQQLTQERADAEAAYPAALKLMRDKKGENRALLGRAEAHKAQTAAILATQGYVDHYRKEFAIQGVIDSVNGIGAVLREEILPELLRWADVLALNTDSLHRRVIDGAQRVRTERQRATEARNHRVIDDQTWEASKYEEKVADRAGTDTTISADSARDRFFTAWQWAAPVTPVNQAPVFKLDVVLGGKPLRKDTRRDHWARDNQNLMIEQARSVFRDAVREETVLSYLMNQQYAGNPQALATELAANSGYLLSYNATNRTSGTIKGTIILAFHDGSRPDQTSFLRQTLTGLVAAQGGGNIDGMNDPTRQIVECRNRFQLTILSTLELLPLEDTKSWNDGKDAYQNTPVDTRQKNHNFAAEIRAAEYEIGFYDRLGQRAEDEVGGKKRLMTDRVCLLLEDEKKFMQFLVLWAHGQITIYDDANNTVQTYWVVTAPSQDQRFAHQLDEWRLTVPASEDPSERIVDALVHFINIGTDATNSSKHIPYDHLSDYLKRVIDHQMAERLQNDDLALDDPELRGWLEAFLPPLVNGQEDLTNWTPADDELRIKVARYVTRHDVLRRLENQLMDVLSDFVQRAKEARAQMNTSDKVNEAIHRQELLDLYSVAVIALQNEMNRYRALVEQEYNRQSRNNRIGGVARRRRP